MTNDYKEKLIQYITNNFEFSDEVETTTPGGAYERVHEDSINTQVGSSLFNYIAELLLELDRSSIRINGMLQINNSSTKVIYGGYSKTDGSNTSEGFLILVDEDFNGITMLREYESGTRIREVQFLAQDENNNIYGVVGDIKNSSEQKYFTMLNNFAMPINNEYTLVLRKNYSLADAYFRCIDITKKQSESEYLIVGCDLVNSGNECLSPRGINFKINVGSANEITRLYNRGNLYNCFGIYSNYNDDGYPYIKAIAQASSGNSKIINVYTNINGTTSSTQVINYASWYADRNTYRIRQTKDDDGGIYFQMNFINESDTSLHGYYLWYLDEYDNLNMVNGLQSSSVQFAWTIINNGWYDENNVGRPFMIQHAAQMTYYEDDPDNPFLMVDMGGIAIKNAYDVPNTMNNITDLIMYPNYSYNQFLNNLIILTNRDFNLLSIFTIQSELTTDNPANVLTILKRPGLQINEQDTYESFQPKYVDIRSNDEIKFSRNIYDSVVYSNTSVDSVEVPYNYLNGIQIQGQDLWGAKNMKFVEDNTQWTKNRYENIDINFINKINVYNRDKSENLLSQAINLNSEIHRDLEMANGTANILLADGTFDMVPVEWKALTQYTYQVSITTIQDKNIIGVDWSNALNGVEFIQEFDEELELGEQYTIKQKITINNEFYKTGLLYNGVQVQYNGEDVLVQSEEM